MTGSMGRRIATRLLLRARRQIDDVLTRIAQSDNGIKPAAQMGCQYEVSGNSACLTQASLAEYCQRYSANSVAVPSHWNKIEGNEGSVGAGYSGYFASLSRNDFGQQGNQGFGNLFVAHGGFSNSMGQNSLNRALTEGESQNSITFRKPKQREKV